MAEKIVKDSQGLAKELVNGVKEFEELKVIDLNGRPYYSIIYLENGNEFEGYASYNLKVISEYLKRHFGFAQPETHDKRTEKHACDLIDRQMAIDGFYEMASDMDYLCTVSDYVSFLESLPSAQPERKRGKWIIKDNPGTGWYRVTCSECGEDVTSTAPCIGFYPNAKVTWDYCPNCGADMREVAE